MAEKTTYIIVGYVPLMYDYNLGKDIQALQYNPKQMDRLAKKMDRYMENAPMPTACLWSKGDKGIGPVFLIEQGEKLQITCAGMRKRNRLSGSKSSPTRKKNAITSPSCLIQTK
jgi:hypothetical protein